MVTLRAAFLALLLLAGSACASSAVTPGHVTLPPGGGAVIDYQLGGAYEPAAGVRIVDRDRTDRPAKGHYNVCYVNAFQTQPQERPWWRQHHPDLLLRKGNRYVIDPGWPDEYLLDTSTAAKRRALTAIVGRWIDGCARAGFQAVEPDNLDSWTRRGVDGSLSRNDNLALATSLAARAHRDGLAIAQKNTVEISQTGRRSVHFDFAVAEECQQFHECALYRKAYGSRVYEIEYSAAAYRAACKDHRGRNSIILRDREVVARGTRGYVFKHC